MFSRGLKQMEDELQDTYIPFDHPDNRTIGDLHGKLWVCSNGVLEGSWIKGKPGRLAGCFFSLWFGEAGDFVLAEFKYAGVAGCSSSAGQAPKTCCF